MIPVGALGATRMVVVEVTTAVDVVVLVSAVMVTRANPLVAVLVSVVIAVEVVVTGVATREQAEETMSARPLLAVIRDSSPSESSYQGHSREEQGQRHGGQQPASPPGPRHQQAR